MCFDYEAVSFGATYRRRARKPHRCAGCGRKIEPGDHYEHECGFYDGRFYTRDACEACVYLRALVYASEVASGCMPHESWCCIEEVREDAAERGWWWPGAPRGCCQPEEDERTVVRWNELRPAC